MQYFLSLYLRKVTPVGTCTNDKLGLVKNLHKRKRERTYFKLMFKHIIYNNQREVDPGDFDTPTLPMSKAVLKLETLTFYSI